jgi:uncharacterized protein with FMN-binding domain
MEYAIGAALVAAIESVVSCDIVASHWQQRLTKTDNNKMNEEDEGGCSSQLSHRDGIYG